MSEPLWSTDKWWHEVQQVKGTAQIAGNNVDYIELADAEELFEKVVADYEQRIAELEAEIAEQQSSFELRWNADMRAIQQWQEATGKELQWPNHIDLCVWLMRQLDNAQAELARLREQGQWEPVTVGFIRCTTSSHSMQVEMDTEGQLVAIGPYGEHSVTAFDMPEGYAICRRNADAQPQPVEREGWCDNCGDTIMVNEVCDSCGKPAADEAAQPKEDN